MMQETAELGAALSALGKTMIQGVREYAAENDLEIEGIPAEFPPPRSLDARPNNLPSQLTSFVGREQDMADVILFLASDRSSYVNGDEIMVDGGYANMLMNLVPRPGFE